jgi:hypothetical protein
LLGHETSNSLLHLGSHCYPLKVARNHPRLLFFPDELQRFFLLPELATFLPEQGTSQWPEAAKILPKIRSPSALTGRWPMTAFDLQEGGLQLTRCQESPGLEQGRIDH